MEKAKTRSIIVCLTLIVAMLLGGCASENAIDTSSKAENDVTSASVSDASVEASIDVSDDSTDTSKTNGDVNDESDNLSADVSIENSDNESNSEVNDTEAVINGKQACEIIVDYSIKAAHALALELDLVDHSAKFTVNNMECIEFATDFVINEKYGVETTERFDNKDVNNNFPRTCILWQVTFTVDTEAKGTVLYVPVDAPEVIALYEHLDVPQNELNRINFSKEDIEQMDAKSVEKLIAAIKICERYTALVAPEL